MTKEEREYLQTNSYIQIAEQREKDWNDTYQEERNEKRALMDLYLSRGEKSDYNSLFQMFVDDEFRSKFQYKDEFAYMIVLLNIFHAEVTAGETQTVLSLGRSVNELIEQFCKVKFLLWRIEFKNDVQAKADLLSFLKSNGSSTILLQNMIQTVTCRKTEVTLELVDYFLEKQSLKYAFGLLRYLDEAEPGNEIVLSMLADLCGSIGRVEEMHRYLSEIKEPGEWSQRVRKKYEIE